MFKLQYLTKMLYMWKYHPKMFFEPRQKRRIYETLFIISYFVKNKLIIIRIWFETTLNI
jgi:hypothetical protein